jgi:photosystem II stability/assembly factor-like uncharacterized protein
MTSGHDLDRKLYVGLLDGVCALRSNDGGNTWEVGPTTRVTNAASRISVSQVEPGQAYLAAYESGVYRTDDGGNTWRHLTSYPTDYAHSVLAHPAEGSTVFVGSEPAAIFRSSDGGENWEECEGFRQVPESDRWYFHAETRDSHVRDLRMAPEDPNTIFAGIEVGGMVRSKDGGANWEQLEGTNDDIHFVNLSLAMPGRVYIATAQAPYRSDDGGQNWEIINDGLERRYTLHISAAPDDADLVLVTVSTSAGRNNPQFYRSTDAGDHWQLVGSVGCDDDMVVAIDWDPNNHHRVYAGTDSGKIYCSDDRGETWQALAASLPPLAIGALVVGPASA